MPRSGRLSLIAPWRCSQYVGTCVALVLLLAYMGTLALDPAAGEGVFLRPMRCGRNCAIWGPKAVVVRESDGFRLVKADTIEGLEAQRDSGCLGTVYCQPDVEARGLCLTCVWRVSHILRTDGLNRSPDIDRARLRAAFATLFADDPWSTEDPKRIGLAEMIGRGDGWTWRYSVLACIHDAAFAVATVWLLLAFAAGVGRRLVAPMEGAVSTLPSA